MTDAQKETIIRMYFDMWISRDFSKIADVFSEDIYYSECYGPEYFCLSEIHLWIDDMLKKTTRASMGYKEIFTLWGYYCGRVVFQRTSRRR